VSPVVNFYPQQGWILPHITIHSGSGTLTVTIKPIVPTPAPLSGVGNLAVPLTVHYNIGIVGFSGGGLLSTSFSQIAPWAQPWSGDGTLTAFAIPPTGLVAAFAGTGMFAAATEGGWSAGDGLSAWWYQVYTQLIAASGSGTLVASLLSELEDVLAGLSGFGELSGVSTGPVYPELPQLVGSGALSGAAFALYQSLAGLAGSGAIGAALVARYLETAGYTGGSALSTAVMQSYGQPAGQGGAGTLGITVTQLYSPAVALAGTGTLSAVVEAPIAGVVISRAVQRAATW